MKTTVRQLPKTECYPCTRRHVKSAFAGLNLAWIGLGWPLKHFDFDRRATHRPKTRGTVVASATYSPEREAYVCIYVVRRAEYPAEARDESIARVLPQMRRWMEAQSDKPDTAILGYDEMIVEWDGTTHKFHELTLHTGRSRKQVKQEDDSGEPDSSM